jgi:hypothetical protein
MQVNFTQKNLWNAIYITLTIIACITVYSGQAQNNTVIIGADNPEAYIPGGTTPGPVNIYYRSLIYRVHYTKEELIDAGFTIGTITQIGFDVFSLPTYNLPGYTIKMGNYEHEDLDDLFSADLETVYYNSLYAPQAGGFDMLLLDNAFFYDGSDYLVIEICFDMVPDWYSTGVVQLYSFNSSEVQDGNNYQTKYSRSDGSNMCLTEPQSTQYNKPVIQIAFSPVSENDIGAGSLISNNYSCEGDYTPVVEVRNYGINQVTSYTLNWSVNGTLQSPQSITGFLDTFNGINASRDTVSLPVISIQSGEIYTLKVWTSMPNGITDTIINNDTLTTNIFGGIAGLITIGGTDPDFNTLQEAFTFLENHPMCDSIILELRNGSYTGQSILNYNFPSQYPIVIRSESNDPQDVNIQFSGSTDWDQPALLRIDGIDEVYIHGISFSNTNASTSYARLLMLEQVKKLHVENCSLQNPIQLNTSTSQLIYTGAQHLTVHNNFMEGGRVAIYQEPYLYGSGWQVPEGSFTSIYNNDMIDQRSGAIYMYVVGGFDINNNRIIASTPFVTNTYYGVEIYDVIDGNQYTIRNNTMFITRNATIYGFLLDPYWWNSEERIKFYNNSINVENQNSTARVIYLYDADLDMDFNTINVNSLSDNATTMYLYYSDIIARNNIFNSQGNANTISYGSGNTYSGFNNNIFSSGNKFGYNINSQLTYTTYDDLLSILSGEQNGFQFNPFLSIDENILYPGHSGLKNAAVPVSDIFTDILGQIRNVLNPDVGAVEFELAQTDAGIDQLPGYESPFAAGTKEQLAVLINHGSQTLTNVEINWTVNDVAQTMYNWSGTLASGDTTIVNIGNVSFIQDSMYFLKAWTTNPNDSTDQNFTNDSTKVGPVGPGLSGHYTIAGTDPDFTTFSEAVEVFNLVGMIGPVTFEIIEGTHAGTFPMTYRTKDNEPFPFILEGNEGVLLQKQFSSQNYGILDFDGFKNLTVKNLAFQSNTSSSGGVVLRNNSNNVTIEHNHFNMFSGNLGAIVMSASSTNLSYGSGVQRVRIKHNIFEQNNSYLRLYGQTDDSLRTEKNIQIDSNSFVNTNGAILIYGIDSVSIQGNELQSWMNSSTGINIQYGRAYRIKQNNIVSAGIALNINNLQNSPGNPSARIENNMLTSQYNDGFRGNNIEELEFYHNSLRGNRACYFAGSNVSWDIRNNIFASTGNHTITGYPDSPFVFQHFDHNLYYRDNQNEPTFSINNETYEGIAGLQQVFPGTNLNAQSGDPIYNSEQDLHANSWFAYEKADATLGVAIDIDGDPRPLPPSQAPDIGADEFMLSANDAALVDLFNPKMPFAPGEQDIKVVVRNMGADVLTSLQINWASNEVAQSSYQWAGSLGQTQYDTVIIGSLTFVDGEYQSLVIASSLPNGLPDANTANDTLMVDSLIPSMAGIYTIGGVDPDFENIAQAISNLETRSVADTVWFMIRPGTYNSTGANILGDYSQHCGAPVIFTSESGNAEDVIITGSGAWPDYGLFTINGGSGYYFTHLTIDVSSWKIFEIKNNAACIRIEHCILNGANSTSSAAVLIDISGGNNFFVSENNIELGSYAIRTTGDSTYFTNNTVSNYRYGLYAGNMDHLIMRNNAFSEPLNSNPGIYLYRVGGMSEVSYNEVYKMTGQTLYTYQLNYFGSTSEEDSIRIFNNHFESSNTGNNFNYVIYDWGSKRVYFDNNTIRRNHPNEYSVIFISNPEDYQFRNNNVYQQGTGIVLELNVDSTYMADHNNYYSAGGNLFEFNGTEYPDLVSFQSANNLDENSMQVDPDFTNLLGPETKNISIALGGTPVAWITDDLYGDERDAQNPSIGALEVVPFEKDLSLVQYQGPKPMFPSGSQDILLQIQNNGNTDITQFILDWKINGIAQTSYFWNGTLESGEMLDSFPVANVVFQAGELYDFEFIIASVNNLGEDDNPFNDTLQSGLVSPSLCGSYTLGGANSNFDDFVHFSEVLNVSGVLCPVLVEANPGTYIGQPSFMPYPGMEHGHEIVLESMTKDSSSVWIKGTPNSTSNYVIQYSGANNITLRHLSLGLDNPNTSQARLVTITGGENRNLQFDHMHFEGMSTNSTSNIRDLIFETGSTRVPGLQITNSYFLNGATAIDLSSSFGTTWQDTGVVIKNNYFEGQRYGAIYMVNQHLPQIRKNVITKGYNYPSTNTAYPIYISTGNAPQIIDNQIFEIRYSSAGIYCSSCHSADTTYTLIANNFVTSENNPSNQAISVNSSMDIYVLHNTIHAFSTGSAAYAFQLSNNSSAYLYNNLFYSQGQPVVRLTGNAELIDSDHNNFYTTGNTLINLTGTENIDVPDLASWQIQSEKDMNSLSVNPLFPSPYNYQTQQFALNNAGISLPQVDQDIEGNLRNSDSPDIGCWEFGPQLPADAGIAGLINPTPPFANGNQAIKIALRNDGVDTLNQVQIFWSVNNTAQTPLTWTGTLASEDSVWINVGNFTFEKATEYEIRAWVSNPNGFPDQNPTNDTLKVEKLWPALQGIYTLGGVAPDFFTWLELEHNANYGGILAPATVNVRNNIYNSKLELRRFPGTNPDRLLTIRSESGDSSLVVLQSSGSNANNNYVVWLRNARNVKFEQISLKSTATSWAKVVDITEKTGNITFQACYFENAITGATDNNAIRSLVYASGFGNDSMFFVNNHFERGSRAVYFNPHSSSRSNYINFTGNTFHDFRGYGLFNTNTDNIVIQSNEFITVANNGNGLYLQNIGGISSLTQNFFDIFNGSYTVNISSVNTTSNNPLLIANNFITNRRNLSGYGLYISSTSNTNIDIIFNSIHVISSNNNSYGVYIYGGWSNLNYNYANNISRVTGPGIPAGFHNSPSIFAYLNHNNYFTDGTNLIASSGNYSTLADWQNATGFDANSLNLDPLFVGDADLHVQQIALAGAGTSWPGITIDIDGETRNENFPDIGADEFEFLGSNIGIAALDYPNPISCDLTDSFNISVLIQNFGGIPASGFDVGYTLGNDLPVLENVGPLVVMPGQSMLYTFNHSESNLAFQPHDIIAYTLLLNDEGPENDTLETSFLHVQPLSQAPANMLPPDEEAGVQLPVPFSWSAAPSATHYSLFVWEEGTPMPASPQVASTSNLNINFSTGLSYGTTYEWMVRAHNQCSSIDSEIQTFTLRQLPDLEVVTISNPDVIFSGQQLTVTWTVQNTGQGSTLNQAWWDRVRISPDPDLSVGTTLGNISNLTALDAGESYQQTAVFNVPLNLTGTYYVTVRTDVYNQVPELSTANNTMVSPTVLEINLTPPPDLQVTNIQVPTFAFSGSQINVQYTVSNLGATPTQVGTWLDRIRLADNPDAVNLTNMKNVTYSSGILLPDSSYTRNEVITLPEGIFGSYYIYVQTDVNNVVFEHAFSANNTSVSDSIEVLLVPPVDLVVSEITAPSIVSPNEVVNISYTVTNQGGSTPNVNYWLDRIYISTEPELTSAASFLGNQTVSGIVVEPDSSYTKSRNVTIPAGLSGDQYYFLVYTNGYGHVYEFEFGDNNVNNSTTQLILPDLKPFAVLHPSSDTTGNSITINYTNKNEGPGLIRARSWRDKIYLSESDSFPESGALQVADIARNNQTWQPGHEVSYSQSIYLPHGLNGDYYVYVKTDANGQINEADETNNIARGDDPLEIVQGPVADLAVVSLNAPDTAISGIPVTITGTIQNIGSAPALPNWNDRVYTAPVPQWPGVNQAIQRISLTRTQVIQPGQTYAFSAEVVFPPAPPGVDAEQFFLYLLTDFDNQVFEFNTSNNLGNGVPIVVKYLRPDFAITDWSVPDSGTTGAPVLVHWQVENLEADNLSQYDTWKDGIFLSTSPGLTGNTILVEEVDITTEFYPNTNTYYVQASLQLPQSMFGNLYLVVHADHNNVTGDLNPANNVASSPIHVSLTPIRDLTVSNMISPTSVVAGQPFDVIFTITNQGDGPTISGGWTDRLYLTQGGPITSNTQVLGNKVRQENLNAGESYTDTLSVFVPVNQSGNFVLNLFTDATNLEYEHLAENNNQYTANISVVQPPPADLIVTDIFMPDEAQVNDEVNIQWTVYNIGDNTAQGYMQEAVYLSPDPEWSLDDYLVGVFGLSINIPSQGTLNRQISATVPGLPVGDYYVIVRTDVKNNIYESNTQNNTSASVNTIFVDIPEMVLDTWYNHNLANTEKVYYRINIPESLMGESLIIETESNSGTAINELYMRHNLVPTKANFDFQQDEYPQPEPQLIVPELQFGTYYLMAESNNYLTGTFEYDLKARILEFEITTVDANKGGNTGKVTTLLRGAKYTQDMTAWLRKGGLSLKADTVYYIDPTRVFATFNLALNGGFPTGWYDVELSKPDGQTAIKTDGFEVVPGGPDEILTVFTFPSAVMVPSRAHISVQLTNAGLNDVPVQLRSLISVNNAPLALSTSELSLGYKDVFLEFQESGGPPGILRPGVSLSRQVFTRLSWAGFFGYYLINVNDINNGQNTTSND